MAVDEEAVWGEGGGGVDAEYGRESGCVYVGLGTVALDGVLHPVEEERVPEEFE